MQSVKIHHFIRQNIEFRVILGEKDILILKSFN